jgi:mono/diheme cytochrome c family protein
MSARVFPAILTLLSLSGAHLPGGEPRDARALWVGGVQQLFDRHCVKCHGPLEQKSGLELDTPESVLKGDEIGPVIVPGKPDESAMVKALAPGSDPHMPPKKQLSGEEIAQIREWITRLGVRSADGGESDGQTERNATATVTFSEPVVAIDQLIAKEWERRGVSPAPSCDDRTFIRRIFLDLAGRIPTSAEVEAFLYDATPHKREVVIDQLLASDEYARTFREIWDALLMGRNVGRREQRRRENGWFDFLENAFKQNRPWDQVVHAMILARPDKPEDKGALWFLFERRNEHQQMAEAIAPVIYGTRVDCAQCHDHPLAREIKQAHYWGLVAAFNRSKNVERRPPAVAESAIGGFVNFTNLKKESQPAVMTMLTGRTIDEARPAADTKEEDSPDGYVDPAAAVKTPKFSRRAALADAATRDNPLLARAFVNHTWAILLGRGIVHPVDEINSKHPASHPELLEWLADDFGRHGYDVKRLVRAIVSSRVYQLAGSNGSTSPAPELFAVAAEKPLTAEALARSTLIASGAATMDDSALRQRFVEIFPDVLPRVPRATIQQAMLLSNSERLAELFRPAEGNNAARLGVMPRVEDRVREAFRVVLARQPDGEEFAESVNYLNARSENPAVAAGQLLWVLASGAEFLTNH